ncbi:stressosome-associated protein Prli42 [Schinkia sp. CFF1]
MLIGGIHCMNRKLMKIMVYLMLSTLLLTTLLTGISFLF